MKFNLTIGKKITGACAIMLLPIGILGYFLIAEKTEQINFAKKEIAGLAELQVKQQELASLLSATGNNSEEHKANLDHATDALSSISDNSNITLDPDMDTYYVGDVIVNQGPAILKATDNLLAAAATLGNENDNYSYAKARDELSVRTENYVNNLTKAYSGNNDGLLKKNLATDSEQVIAALEKLLDSAKVKDIAAIKQNAADVQAKLKPLLLKANEEMKRMLELRIAGFHENILYRLGISFGLVLVGLVLAGLVIRSVSRPLRASTANAGSLAEGDYKVSIAETNRHDEVGELARAMVEIKTAIADYSGQINAIRKSQAVIEFNLDGSILTANDNFLNTLGYKLEEIVGKHHSLFVDAAYKNSSEYQQFWNNLKHGEYQAGEFKRITKSNKEIWIQASYNPILDPNGKPFKVVKYATEITAAKMESMHAARLKLALDTCTSNIMMADAGFNIIYLNGAVTSFLQEAEKDIQKDLPRFSVASLIGSNIDIFHKNPAAQRGMLEQLNSPHRTSIQVGGRSFNLVANPIFGTKGERLGTVVEWQDGAAAGMVDAINKSQAVIEFSTDGSVLNANGNFLSVMGYTLEEIRGKHHSLFVEPAYKASAEYKQFWEALNRGEAQSGEYKRVGKGGSTVWIQASYNPILDLRGKVVRVVKTASDTTQMVTTRIENEQGMNEAVKVLSGIAEGKLTQKMELEYKGTFSQIKTAVNATVDRLFDMVKRIIEAAQSVNSAASEIASGSTDLSQRTEEQASSLEETAASMEQITGTVRANSENARNANDLSTQANQVATNGGKVVEEAVTAMESIEKSSKKISDIIGVIDEIAFQTNLLALNAAVEAARAGEAGKGFAVVAAEVRSLAGRSASASKEIKALINESASQVQTGAELVNRAGTTLKDIVGSVQKVASIVSEISAASQEQSTGIDEINTAITQMDETTQQNAALVEENTAAAQSMVEQAQELKRLMDFFTIDGNIALEAQGEEIVKPASDRRAPSSPMRKAQTPKRPAAVTKSVKQPAKPAVTAKAANGHSTAEDGWQEF